MAQILQAKCPGCQKLLRIPAEWTAGMVRCKQCGMTVRVRPKSTTAAVQAATPPPVPVVPSEPTATEALTAVPPAPPVGAAEFPPPPETTMHDPFGGFTEGGGEALVVPRFRRKRRSGLKSALTVLAVLGVVAVAAGGVYWKMKDSSSANVVDTRPKKKPTTDLATAAGDFPRRLLAVSVNNYWYANPVSYGEKDRTVGGIVARLGEALRIPKDQIVELSDSAKKEPRAPLKPVIEKTVEDFLTSCRSQDRIILLFVGHAVEIGDEAYLVPIEGELTVKDGLIPVKWLYEKLAACKARQKVLIADVCRFDPSRGLERPGSGPMGPKLDAILKAPPPGVQVWSACVAGQYSYESGVFLPSREFAHSGLFLNEIFEAVGPLQKKRVQTGIQRPEEPLAIDLLANGDGHKSERGPPRGVNPGTEHEANEVFSQKQTPRLVGDEPTDGVPYDAAEPMPRKLEIKPPEMPKGIAPAPLSLVTDIVNDLNRVPPVKQTVGLQALRPESLKPFSANLLQKYAKKGGEMTPMRKAVNEASALLAQERIAKAFNESFTGESSDAAIKKRIATQQREPAVIQSELLEVLETLQKFAEKDKYREDPSPYWQAQYLYVMSRVEQRIVYVYEYNFAFGQIRKDALPPRDPSKSSGWRLASTEKVQGGTESRNMMKNVKDHLKKLATQHAGTPWEILAKRESLTALGLDWKVARE